MHLLNDFAPFGSGKKLEQIYQPRLDTVRANLLGLALALYMDKIV
jgi:hypothetical protein